MTTRGSPGHVLPLAPFGQACVRAGHQVTVAAQRLHRANVERTGLNFSPTDDLPDDEWMPRLGEFAQLGIDAASELMIREFFAGIDVRAALPGLRGIVDSWHPDVVVRESWEFASTLVAELHGIPVVRVGLGLAAVEELSTRLASGALEEARANLGLVVDRTGERLRNTPYFTMMPEALEDPASPPPPLTHRFHPGGGSAVESMLPDWWPGNDDPLVYLTFGSVTAGAHLPYFPRLYRTAIDALAPLPVRILVTVGDSSRSLDDFGPLPPNVHAEHWVAHDAVASQAAVIVCHGGYGSTLGALAHGVPLVVVPLFSIDQWVNGDAVARAGAGIALDADRLTRRVFGLPDADTLGELSGAAWHVLDDPAFRRAARRVADTMKGLPPVEAAVDALTAISAQAARDGA